MNAFRAPWCTALKVVSFLTTAILLAVALIPSPMPWPVRCLVLAIPAGALPFAIFGYEIREGALYVRRLGWLTRIDLSGLKSAQFEPSVMCGSIRTCGNGGLYSFTGWYWNKKIGSYRAYATDLRQTVVLAFESRRIVVSPDDPEAFVRALSGLCRG